MSQQDDPDYSKNEFTLHLEEFKALAGEIGSRVNTQMQLVALTTTVFAGFVAVVGNTMKDSHSKDLIVWLLLAVPILFGAIGMIVVRSHIMIIAIASYINGDLRERLRKLSGHDVLGWNDYKGRFFYEQMRTREGRVLQTLTSAFPDALPILLVALSLAALVILNHVKVISLTQEHWIVFWCDVAFGFVYLLSQILTSMQYRKLSDPKAFIPDTDKEQSPIKDNASTSLDAPRSSKIGKPKAKRVRLPTYRP